MPERTISLTDCNAFYAACEVIRNPALRGRPLLIAGDPQNRHGIVLTASYEARRAARGGKVSAGMPLWKALQLLPRDTVVLPPDHEWYAEVSRRVMAILGRFSPTVEVASVDEAWSDWTGCTHLFGGSVRAMAEAVKTAIAREVGITVSVGVGWSRISAKMAAEMQKPDGLTILTPGDWAARIYPLPAGELYGVGPRTVPKLAAVGIQTIGDLAEADPEVLRRLLGKTGLALRTAARAEDTDPVTPRLAEEAKSIGHSITLPRDAVSPDEVRATLLTLSDQVGTRLRRHGLAGRTVTITIRDTAFRTITRSRTLPAPTDATGVIYQTAAALFDAHWQAGKPVRLLGVQVSRLAPVEPEPAAGEAGAAPDGSDPDRMRRCDRAIDVIRARFGENAIVRATQVASPTARQMLDPRRRGGSFQRDRLADPGGDP